MVAFWFCSSGEELYATIITLLSIFQKMICSKDMRGASTEKGFLQQFESQGHNKVSLLGRFTSQSFFRDFFVKMVKISIYSKINC